MNGLTAANKSGYTSFLWGWHMRQRHFILACLSFLLAGNPLPVSAQVRVDADIQLNAGGDALSATRSLDARPGDKVVVEIFATDYINTIASVDFGGGAFDPGNSFKLNRASDTKTPDFDGDGTVGFSDFLLFAQHFGKTRSAPDFDARFDLDSDGAVGFSDFLVFAQNFGKTIVPPVPQSNLAAEDMHLLDDLIRRMQTIQDIDQAEDLVREIFMALDIGAETPDGILINDTEDLFSITAFGQKVLAQGLVNRQTVPLNEYIETLNTSLFSADAPMSVEHGVAFLNAMIESVFHADDGSPYLPIYMIASAAGDIQSEVPVFIPETQLNPMHSSLITLLLANISVATHKTQASSKTASLNSAGDLTHSLMQQSADFVERMQWSAGVGAVVGVGLVILGVAATPAVVLGATVAACFSIGMMAGDWLVDQVRPAVGFPSQVSQVMVDAHQEAFRQVTRENAPPEVSFTVTPLSGSVGSAFSFDASGTFDDRDDLNSLKMRWSFGDGRFQRSYVPGRTHVSYTYQRTGDLVVRLEVQDSEGLVGSAFRIISVTGTSPPPDRPPTISIETPSGTQSGDVQIFYTVSDPDGNANDFAVTFESANLTAIATLGSTDAGSLDNPGIRGPFVLKDIPPGRHSFTWKSDSGFDLPGVLTQVRVRMDLGADLNQGPRLARTAGFTVDNRVAPPASGAAPLAQIVDIQPSRVNGWFWVLATDFGRADVSEVRLYVDGRFETAVKRGAGGSYKYHWDARNEADGDRILRLSTLSHGLVLGETTLSVTKTGNWMQLESDSGMPVLSISPAQISVGASPAKTQVRIANTGTGRLQWTISEQETWLGVTSPKGDTGGTGAFSGSGDVTLTVHTAGIGLRDGVHEAAILILSNGGNGEIPVRMVIGAGAPGQSLTANLLDGATMDFVYIPSGTFMMGSPSNEVGRYNDEGPQHSVTITKGFYLGKYEVTQGQWEAVMGTRPWQGRQYVQSNANHPAVYVSWNDAQAFVQKLNEAAGRTWYRLPTEAEWEYACRAGTTTRWSFGDDESKLGDYAWYMANAWDVGLQYAQPVGTKLPNPWGLYDMHGNVWEWIQDRYGSYTSGSKVDPTGAPTDSGRVARGGSFSNPAWLVRSANRDRYAPSSGSLGFGFRLLRIE